LQNIWCQIFAEGIKARLLLIPLQNRTAKINYLPTPKVNMKNDNILPEPGLIILFGSGETSPSGRKVFDRILRLLPNSPRIALLETPAGFELNSEQVIGRVSDFFIHRLQNYSPQVEVVSARKRGTPFSPDEPEIVAPLLKADMIFMGPGSPSYAIRQLRDSLAWYYLIARHRLGATLALASAATVAISDCALPVYEIYKVGEDLHWVDGLNFFGLYGLQLVFIPHWNNTEGGEELDTSRCFMGQERFAQLMEMLPEETTIVGLDEKTALIMDPTKSECHVSGLGMVTLLHTGHKHTFKTSSHSSSDVPIYSPGRESDLAEIVEHRGGHFHQYQDGQSFSLSAIGPFRPYHPEASLPSAVWQQAMQALQSSEAEYPLVPPDEVSLLIQEREAARLRKDWITSDNLRKQIADLGWQVVDTKEGPVSKKSEN
jgi:cyanophycinase-like exopeptidase